MLRWQDHHLLQTIPCHPKSQRRQLQRPRPHLPRWLDLPLPLKLRRNPRWWRFQPRQQRRATQVQRRWLALVLHLARWRRRQNLRFPQLRFPDPPHLLNRKLRQHRKRPLRRLQDLLHLSLKRSQRRLRLMPRRRSLDRPQPLQPRLRSLRQQQKKRAHQLRLQGLLPLLS